MPAFTAPLAITLHRLYSAAPHRSLPAPPLRHALPRLSRFCPFLAARPGFSALFASPGFLFLLTPPPPPRPAPRIIVLAAPPARTVPFCRLAFSCPPAAQSSSYPRHAFCLFCAPSHPCTLPALPAITPRPPPAIMPRSPAPAKTFFTTAIRACPKKEKYPKPKGAIPCEKRGDAEVFAPQRRPLF